MKHNPSIYFFFVFFCCVGKGRGHPAAVVIDYAGKVFSTIKFGREVMRLLQGGENVQNTDKKIISEIRDRIENSKTEILTSVLLQSRLERIEDVVISLHSALIDLENIIQPQSSADRKKYKQLFVSRFNQNNVITQIRVLPELLSYVVPGSSGALLDLFARSTRCNMTAVYDFKLYYMKLLSNGIALQVSYLQISDKLSINKTIDTWISHTDKLSLEFDTQENACTEKFAEYANEDIKTANDADKLWKNNNERYTWKNNDVIFLNLFGTYQFLYLKHADGYLFWHRSDKNKIAIFTDKEKHERQLNASILEKAKGNLKAAISGKSDKNAAKNVGEAVEKYVNDQGYTVLALVVFFEGADFSVEKIVLSNKTRSLQVTLDDVQLTYCYKSGAECNLDYSNILGGHKEAHGVMRVFAYINETEEEFANFEHSTNSVSFKFPFGVFIYLSILFCVYINYCN